MDKSCDSLYSLVYAVVFFFFFFLQQQPSLRSHQARSEHIYVFQVEKSLLSIPQCNGPSIVIVHMQIVQNEKRKNLLRVSLWYTRRIYKKKNTFQT